ncbi:MAG TPA: cytochrome C biogenesis protein [Allosphingosinicella sp.]|nr:cytochrome C biogenesis protein [Allosphingosinicella sp.]
MGWLAMIGLAALTALGLGFFLRRDKGALQFMLSALLLALAGYSFQGRPEAPGAPKRQPVREQVPESEFAKVREDTLGRFNNAGRWLGMAESMQERGDYLSAAQLLQGQTRRHPRDVSLWVGFGNALVLHGGGRMSPAAELAFQRAAEIAPDHPAPPFFYGLARAQAGDFDGAEQIWRRLAARPDLTPDYRRLIEERLQAIAEARATGQIPSAPAQPQAAPEEPAN